MESVYRLFPISKKSPRDAGLHVVQGLRGILLAVQTVDSTPPRVGCTNQT